jgi:phenylalanyl-tRNA synthetase beta chain
MRFTGHETVIADDNGVESIAGVMGGEHSGCDETTTDVLIESALWNRSTSPGPAAISASITDARYRFERGVDPNFTLPGLDTRDAAGDGRCAAASRPR